MPRYAVSLLYRMYEIFPLKCLDKRYFSQAPYLKNNWQLVSWSCTSLGLSSVFYFVFRKSKKYSFWRKPVKFSQKTRFLERFCLIFVIFSKIFSISTFFHFWKSKRFWIFFDFFENKKPCNTLNFTFWWLLGRYWNDWCFLWI